MMRTLQNFFLSLLVITISACGSSEENVHNFVASVKKNSKGQIVPLPPEKEYTREEYSAQDYRSPFESGPNIEETGLLDIGLEGKHTVSKNAMQTPRPDADRPREYLEHFPLDDFVMVGTMSKKAITWGLVQDKNGMIHAVKVGNYIGENSGLIIGVSDDKINITETIPNGSGGWMKSTAFLALRVSDTKTNNNVKAKTSNVNNKITNTKTTNTNTTKGNTSKGKSTTSNAVKAK